MSISHVSVPYLITMSYVDFKNCPCPMHLQKIPCAPCLISQGPMSPVDFDKAKPMQPCQFQRSRPIRDLHTKTLSITPSLFIRLGSAGSHGAGIFSWISQVTHNLQEVYLMGYRYHGAIPITGYMNSAQIVPRQCPDMVAMAMGVSAPIVFCHCCLFLIA